MTDTTVKTLLRIQERFLDILVLRLEKIDHHLRLAQRAPDCAEADLQEIESVLHQIAGTAGTLGFGTMGMHARNVETALFDIRMHARPFTVEIYAAIEDFLNAAIQHARKAA